MTEIYRKIPSVDKSLKAILNACPDLKDLPQNLLKELVIAYWNNKRELIKKGDLKEDISIEAQLPALKDFIRDHSRPVLRPVLNASGVIVHTNLGRSVLSEEACAAVLMAAREYSSLEMNLDTGERGSRQDIIRKLLCRLTGAEDALVVNNNAAAVLLILDSLCAGGETIVSRGELVEIGGSFRIPDIMQKSGSILKEVGTTNRTNIADYRQAINEQTKALMKVHASNFRIIGFQNSVELNELRKLADEYNLPLVFDLGSGSLLDFARHGLRGEPCVRDALAEGADIVCFSGDKVLGGPQAGIIAGKSRYLEKLKNNPLARALRCDKLCIAALEATLRQYLDEQTALENVPTPAMMTRSAEELDKDALSLMEQLEGSFQKADIACKLKLAKDSSRVGGGSFPEYELPTTLICLYPEKISAQELRQRLLHLDMPLIGRLEKDAFCLDTRTLFKRDYSMVIKTLCEALSQ